MTDHYCLSVERYETGTAIIDFPGQPSMIYHYSLSYLCLFILYFGELNFYC
jgi:hypothetical protein